MLSEYSEVLSSGGCDDMLLDDTSDNREIERLVIEWSGDPDLYKCAPNELCLTNWMVAETLADLLLKDER